MRHTAGRLNRVWLTIIGVILFTAGALATAIGFGLLQVPAVGDLRAPASDQPVLTLTAPTDVLSIALIAGGAMLGILALLWLLAQVPRKHGASTLKIEDPDTKGLTVLKPTLLEDAISDRVAELDDVTGARTVVRGSSRTPDITVRVTASSHADIPSVLADVEHRITNDVRDALGQRPAALAIEVDIRTEPKKDTSVTFRADALSA
ncbi:alkaline shock response membrane anchor protein AmaP [Arthrobacter agilis]|uniref:alkaline shock response membrane anchor protein AmaP n=1 Tax=Arthrobacter agilis TaxID=37921 RepID=UPI00277D5847|nr:alkaline shock response membrane anchor protein AmaP [Arthrobacter agilis]MDQ0734854.1 putative alkaline shock family protein YloU [Arthrobacter agilis]